jgi:hypothetical protein
VTAPPEGSNNAVKDSTEACGGGALSERARRQKRLMKKTAEAGK